MISKPSPWKECVLDYNRSATEFTGDDVDRFTALVDLGRPFSGVQVFVPTIDSGAVSVYIQRDNNIDTVPVIVHYRQTSDNATAAMSTTASTGGYVFEFPVSGIQCFRLYTGANQTADRTFYVRGV